MLVPFRQQSPKKARSGCAAKLENRSPAPALCSSGCTAGAHQKRARCQVWLPVSVTEPAGSVLFTSITTCALLPCSNTDTLADGQP